MRRATTGKRSVPRRVWLVLLAAGCVSAPPLEEDPDAAGRATASHEADAEASAWAGKPLSWEKLGAIEAWLDAHASDPRRGLVARAELELAEGRLAFARRETRTAPSALAQRLVAAEQGFQHVLATPGVDAGLLRRAHQGLLEARGMRARAGGGGVAADAPVVRSLLRRGQWGASPAVASRMTRHAGAWDSITIHHSAEENAEQLGTGSQGEVAGEMRRLQKFHMTERGYGDLGYHFLIDPQGRVYEGRSLEWQGAHAGGENNVNNIGVCLLGNFLVETPRPAALEALQELTDELARRYAVPRGRVYSHRDLRATECPGGRLAAWVQRYRGSTTAAAHHAAARRPTARQAGHIR